MVVFSCSSCEYTSYKKCNVDRHTKRYHTNVEADHNAETVCKYCSKTFTTRFNCLRHETETCKDRTVTENVNTELENVNITRENVNIHQGFVNILGDFVNIGGASGATYKCEQCYKTFTTRYWRDKHVAVCKKIESPNQCGICKKVFSCRQAKSRHMKTCTPVEPESVNDFGCETGNLLTNDVLDAWHNYSGKGVIQLIKHVHFNPDYPANQNLRLGSNKKRICVRENGQWVEDGFHEKFGKVFQFYTDKLYNRLEDPVVVERLSKDERLERYNTLKKIDARTNPNLYYNLVESFRVMLEKLDKPLDD